jgi:hypothetical protein
VRSLRSTKKRRDSGSSYKRSDSVSPDLRLKTDIESQMNSYNKYNTSEPLNLDITQEKSAKDEVDSEFGGFSRQDEDRRKSFNPKCNCFIV